MNVEKAVIKLFIVMVLGLLFTFPTMWLLNYVVAPTALLAVFGIAKMTFWKTFAFGVITGLLFRRD